MNRRHKNSDKKPKPLKFGSTKKKRHIHCYELSVSKLNTVLITEYFRGHEIGGIAIEKKDLKIVADWLLKADKLLEKK